MRPTVIRRTALAACAASLALVATACGGTDSGGAGADGAKAEESAPAQPAAVKALTAAELEKAALVQGDVKGHKISKAGKADTVAAADVTAADKACDSFADALMGAQVGKPSAANQRKVVSEPKKEKKDGANAEEAFKAAFDITTTMTSLSSYDGKGAQDTVAALRTAATQCSGGFDFTVAGEKQKIVKIEEEKVSGGEEAVAWTVVLEQDGEKGPLKLVVARQGATVASFTSLNLAASGAGEDFGLPTAVVDAQLAKLA
ncbi:hypothetical protein [Streptomyces sp. NBC_00316]|uniref:hypothetical protein n=1 Tax=Streptomyces sp. NBC_00316 TaxID=2975710 RepID=UPI002E2DB1EA|nr:hypothetical protein [Streptomyces sp. NBC_00316]